MTDYGIGGERGQRMIADHAAESDLQTNSRTMFFLCHFYPSISNWRNDTWPPCPKRSSQLLRMKPAIRGLSSAVARSLLRSSSSVKSPPPMRGRRNLTLGPSIPFHPPTRTLPPPHLCSIPHSTR